jgi:hypothetical protein
MVIVVPWLHVMRVRVSTREPPPSSAFAGEAVNAHAAASATQRDATWDVFEVTP